MSILANKISIFTVEEDETDKKKEAKSKLKDKRYNKYHKTEMVALKNGLLTYCKHFKYPGSWVSHNL